MKLAKIPFICFTHGLLKYPDWQRESTVKLAEAEKVKQL